MSSLVLKAHRAFSLSKLNFLAQNPNSSFQNYSNSQEIKSAFAPNF
ncbi:hypothetical protein HMPREF1575_00735 [Gardnerella vaginalis JCP7672]|nr:hypothetical protein HMPREF1575_00735 [Gardnerella vaginalis JCP7672]